MGQVVFGRDTNPVVYGEFESQWEATTKDNEPQEPEAHYTQPEPTKGILKRLQELLGLKKD